MRSTGKRNNQFLLTILMAFVVSIFLANTSPASNISFELEEYLADLDDDDEVGVIIEMLESANLTSKRDKPGKLRALRDVASRSQKKLIKRLKKGKRENTVREYRSFWIFNGLAVTAVKAEVLELAEEPGVKEVRRDKPIQIPPFEPSVVDVDVSVDGHEWGIERIQAPRVWDELGFTGAGIVVGNIDTGVCVDHPDLVAQYRGGTNSWFDAVNGLPGPYDDEGHGTHTMGTICGRDLGGTSIGVAPNATWIAAKGLNSSGLGLSSWLHACFEFMADPDGNPGTDDAPDVINSSWGYNDGTYTGHLLDVQTLNSLGIFTVFSNGNRARGLKL